MEETDMSSKLIEISIRILSDSLKDASEITLLNQTSVIDQVTLSQFSELEKKVFWINVYNAYVQNELMNLDSGTLKKDLFSKRKYTIAHQILSLDDIEHGILRGNKWKFGFGFLPGNYLNKVTDGWKCRIPDSRVHFQLNCGAASCPTIRTLTLGTIEEELEQGKEDFIRAESKWTNQNKKIHVSGLFLFYFRDFKGLRGIRQILNEYFPMKDVRIRFRKFDWTKSPKKTSY